MVEEKNKEITALRKKLGALQVVADAAEQEQEYQKEVQESVALTAKVEVEEREMKQAEKKFKTRQQQLESEIQSIDDKVAQRGKLMTHLNSQKAQHDKMKAAYEKNIVKLEADIQKSHKERDAQLAKLNTKLEGSACEAKQIRERYEEKIATMRRRLGELKQKQKEAASGLALQRQQQQRLGTIEKEMETLKREKVGLTIQFTSNCVIIHI